MTATSKPVAADRLSFLANLRVKAKVFLGFLCVLAILVAVSATGFLSFVTAADQFATFAQRVDVVAIIEEIDFDVTALRRQVREFAIAGEESKAEKAHEIAKDLREQLVEGETMMTDPERLEKTKEIAAQFEAYMTIFDKVVELKHEEGKLTAEQIDLKSAAMGADFEKLQTDAAAAGNSNAGILAGAGLQALMQVRLNANKLLARDDAALAEKVEAYFAEMKKALNGLDGAIKGIGATIQETSEISTAIATAVEEQSAATQEIARNVQQAAAGTQEVSTNISGVTQAAGETGQAAGQVLEAAAGLAKEAEKLRAEVDDFLAKVRAA